MFKNYIWFIRQMIAYNGGLNFNDKFWKFCLRIVISWRRKFSNLICWLRIWVWVIIIRWSLINRFFSCIKFKNDSSGEQKPLFWTLRRSLIGTVLDAWVLPRYKWSLKKPELLYKNVSKKSVKKINDFKLFGYRPDDAQRIAREKRRRRSRPAKEEFSDLDSESFEIFYSDIIYWEILKVFQDKKTSWANNWLIAYLIKTAGPFRQI